MGINADNPVVFSTSGLDSLEASADWAQLRLVQEKILVEGVIAARPVTGIIDTGAEFSIIDISLAASLKLPIGRPTRIQTTGGALAAVCISAVSLEIPGQVRVELPMVAMDLNPVSIILGKSIDFILGGDLLRHCGLYLDIPKGRFRLGPSGLVPRGFTGTPVTLIRNTPFIVVEISGKPIPALLDLGSNGDIDLTPEIWEKIKPSGAIMSDSVNGDLAGNLSVVGKVRLADMQIAGFDERDLDVRIRPATTHLAICGVGATVGLGIINRYSIVLDLPASRLWLEPAENLPARLIDRSGLALAPEATALRVLYVSRGSPALESGWKAGDRICAVNGSPIDGADPKVTEWAKGPAGSIVELTMCGGEVRRLTLKTYY